MRMTKIFAMALVALTIASCSKEEIGGSNNGTGGEEINAPTYATFKFNIGGASSRGDFNPATKPEADAVDSKIGGDLQLLIFNAVTQKLEHNSLVAAAGGSKTVLLTAGRKKIFVVANNEKLPYKGLIEPVTNFKVGEKSLSDFYALKSEAGTPQKIVKSTDQGTTSRDFDFSLLHTLSNTTTGSEAGLPMSNTNEVTYTLEAGVTEAAAQGGSPATGGTSATNSFNIKLYYMVAKARLVLADGVLEATGDEVSDPIIKDVKYSIRNLARVTNYTQNVPTAGNPQSFYYTGAFAENSAQTVFDPEFDYASNLSVAAGSIATPGNYLYVPENNHSMLRRGQSSYFAIKATFEPVVINVVEFDLNNFVKYTYKKLATADATNKNYIYTTKEVQGIPAGTYFSTVKLFEEAAWMMKNRILFVEATHRTEAEGLVTDPTATAPTIDGDYMSFLGGNSYYRVDLGDGAGGAETQYGVLRSNKYDAKINQITGPGVPSEQDLIIDPHAPVSARTYISATITAAVWAPITQSADL